MDAWFSRGKFFRTVVFLTLVAGASGCTFFGRQDAPTSTPAPGQLPDGTSVVGVWSTTTMDVSTSDTPDVATTTTFTFNPDGSAQIETQDLHQNGSSCVVFGQYRVTGSNNVTVYGQVGDCDLPPQYDLLNVQVLGGYLSYVDSTTNDTFFLLGDNTQDSAPVGLWQFNGDLGIDDILFDPHGYFLLQTTDAGVQEILEGYYVVDSGTITLNFFDGTDPSQIVDSLEFTSFTNNGAQLMLEESATSGTSSATGTRL